MDCKTGTKNIIRQINGLLDILDQESYSKPLSIYNGSSIGQHFRHIFDFYRCLQVDLPSGPIDYARRERNVSIEQNPAYARSSFSKMGAAIEHLDEDKVVEVLADFSTDSTATRPVLKSTLGRELMFAHDHAIHHIAIIKIGFKLAFPDLELPEHIGVAPSTLKFRASEKASD